MKTLGAFFGMITSFGAIAFLVFIWLPIGMHMIDIIWSYWGIS